MSAGLQLSYTDLASPKLQTLIGGMTDRTRINKFIENRAVVTTRDYLVQLAQTRHATANRLGAEPTGHLSRAAESVSGTSDGNGATVDITSPGFGRVAGDITIVPKEGKYLTIPANAAAYGKRASEVAQAFGDLRPITFGKDGAHALVINRGTGKDRQTIVFYWLVESVLLKQDRTLLPSNEVYAQVLTDGAKDFFDALLDANYGGLLS
jgi:hypothetical protein